MTVLTQRHAFTKHRLMSGPPYQVDFGRALPTGVTLSSAQVYVFTEAAGPDNDVSAEFGPDNVQIQTGHRSGVVSGGVSFTLDAAGAGDQDAGDYVLRVDAVASDGRTYVSVHRLTVDESGDPGAP